MGCNNSIDIQKTKQNFQVHQDSPKVGKLKIKVLNCDFMENDNKKQKYLQVRVSNQSFISSIHHNFGSGKAMKIDETFNFVINSKIKKYGRMMTIQIWNKQDLRTDKQFALGIVDIDPVLNRKNIQNQLNPEQNRIKCFVNYEKVAAGKVNLTAQFNPCQFRKVTIKIDSVLIRQHFIRERQIYVRTTIGEDIFQTSQSHQTLKQPPKWINQYYVFYVPDFLSQCLIEVLQKNKTNLGDILIGELKLDLKVLMTLTSQKPIQTYSQQIQIDDQITGVIKFHVFDGQIKSDLNFELLQPGSPKKISHKQKKILTSPNVLKDQINQKTNDKITKVKQRKVDRTFTIESSPKKIPQLKQSHKFIEQKQKTIYQTSQKIQKVQKKRSFINSLQPISIQKSKQNIKNFKQTDRTQENDPNLTQQIKIRAMQKSQLKIKKTESFGLDQNFQRIQQNTKQRKLKQDQFLTKPKSSMTEKIIQSHNEQIQNQEQSLKVFDNSIVKIDISDNKQTKIPFFFIEDENKQQNFQNKNQSHLKLFEFQECQPSKYRAEDQEWQKFQIKKLIQ